MKLIGNRETILSVKYDWDFINDYGVDLKFMILSENEYNDIMDIDNDNEMVEKIHKMLDLRNYEHIVEIKMYYYNMLYTRIDEMLLFGGEKS